MLKAVHARCLRPSCWWAWPSCHEGQSLVDDLCNCLKQHEIKLKISQQVLNDPQPQFYLQQVAHIFLQAKESLGFQLPARKLSLFQFRGTKDQYLSVCSKFRQLDPEVVRKWITSNNSSKLLTWSKTYMPLAHACISLRPHQSASSSSPCSLSPSPHHVSPSPRRTKAKHKRERKPQSAAGQPTGFWRNSDIWPLF